MAAMRNFMLAVLLLGLAGCSFHSQSQSGQQRTSYTTSGLNHLAGPDRLELAYRVEGKDAIMDSDRVTIVFPNLAADTLHSFAFQQGKVAIQIGGDGTSDVSVNCRKNKDQSSFHSHYENGANTILFCGRKVRIENQGRTFVTAAERLDLTTGKKPVRVLSSAAW